MNELVELFENKNKEVENMKVLLANLEQIEESLIRLEFAADEVACKQKGGAGNDVWKTKGEGPDVT